jgi:hypothetical protein
MWHCPHCGAPQAETARCWVCRRSSTTCSTCRHFRASLATDLGYCALDRKRLPLTGRELRGCWSQPPNGANAANAAGSRSRAPSPEPVAARGFVPVEDVAPRREPIVVPTVLETVLPGASVPETPASVVFLVAEPVDAWESRTNLFGDPER